MNFNKKAQPTLLVVPEEEGCEEQGTVSTFLQSRIHESFTRAADQLYAMGLLTTEERIAISSCIGDALEAFTDIMAEKVPSADEIEVPMEVAQEILRNAILHRRQGIVRIAQDEELGVPISSEYLDLPDRDQDHRTLRELIELALVDEVNAQQHYDNMLDVAYQMDLPLDEDLPTRKALEEIFDDERDHEKILLRMLGEPVPKPGLADATVNTAGYKLAKHSFDKCMECSKPPEYEVMWFEGKAHAWFCEAHLEKWLDEDRDRRNGSDIPWIKEVMEGKALKNPTENTNPNIMNRFVKKASLPKTREEFIEELSKLEHDQWVEWSKDIAKNEDISEERLERWKKEYWKPYDKLPEDAKGDDREYAKKALEVVKDYLPFNTAGYKLAKHSFDKCMKCSKPPEYEMLWANGKGHAWFCESHAKEFIKKEDVTPREKGYASDISSVKQIDAGKAHSKFSDNTNENILSEIRKTITAATKVVYDDGLDSHVEKSTGRRVVNTDRGWIYQDTNESVPVPVDVDFPNAMSNVLPTTEAEFFEELVRTAKDEPFRFDPNSTENEGRWRLMDPKIFEQGSVRTWNIWKEMKAPGIQFVMAKDTRDKQWKPQAIRFKKPDWDENKAAEWWEQNKGQFEREWTQVNWDEWMRKHPDEIAPDYTGKISQGAMLTGQLDMPRTLAVDLDGTILEYDGFKGIDSFGSPIDGARETLQRFKEDGWFIVIDTCRGNVPQVIEHLILFDIPFDSVNKHPFQPSTANPGKPLAEYRIDDSAIHFNGDWVSVYDEVGRREQVRSLSAMKIVWQPPIEKKIALQTLADNLSDEEWLDVLPHATEATGDLVVLSRKIGMDTYRMVLCGGEYRAFRNFDPVYRSGGLFNEQELRESFEAVVNSEDPETVESILRGYESYLLSQYRGHGFNNPEQWISITGTAIDGDHRVIYVEADPRSFVQCNELPADDPQSLLILLKKVADGAFAYDPRKCILLDFLNPFGDRAQPTDYPDPVRWGEPEELKKRVRKRRQRDGLESRLDIIDMPEEEGEPAERLDRMKAKRLLDIFG